MRIRLFRYNGTISTNSRIDWKRKINVELPTMTYLWNYIKRSHFLQLCFALNTCALELHNFQGRFTQPSTHNNWGTKHNILVQNHLARCKWPIAHTHSDSYSPGQVLRLREEFHGSKKWGVVVTIEKVWSCNAESSSPNTGGLCLANARGASGMEAATSRLGQHHQGIPNDPRATWL